MPTTLRTATLDDATALAALATQLGYPTPPDVLARRLAVLLADPAQHAVWLAEDTVGIAGWLHAFVRPLLESDPAVEIGGLIVDERCRGQGVGSLLIAACEQWAARHGLNVITVRCAEARQRAHAFYRHQGYQHRKTQLVFRKTLPA